MSFRGLSHRRVTLLPQRFGVGPPALQHLLVVCACPNASQHSHPNPALASPPCRLPLVCPGLEGLAWAWCTRLFFFCFLTNDTCGEDQIARHATSAFCPRPFGHAFLRAGSLVPPQHEPTACLEATQVPPRRFRRGLACFFGWRRGQAPIPNTHTHGSSLVIVLIPSAHPLTFTHLLYTHTHRAPRKGAAKMPPQNDVALNGGTFGPLPTHPPHPHSIAPG